MISTPRRRLQALEAMAEEGRFLEKPVSVWKSAWRRLLRRKTGVTGMILIGFWVLVATFAPLIATHDPVRGLLSDEPGVLRRDPPCIHALGCSVEKPEHYLGLDGNARDEFSRIVYGSRVSLTIGLTTVTAAILVGAALGAIAGYFGSWIDNVIMRIMDVVLGFPALLLAIAIVAVLGPGLTNALLAIAIVTIPQYARVMRASVLQIKELDFVSASRALGASNLRILFSRVIPNALTPLVVLGTLGIAGAILEAAGLSFLGLGAQPPTPEWGTMLGEDREGVFTAPHLVFFPGAAIMLIVLGFNLLGDGLRDALDPRLND
ncbi:MAG TPA: ABC transporter permease [Acidimicrobiia bacterium]|jgi:ABC-type dipeptide/oligopeptide/nickel transport system permease subunit